MRLGVAVGGDNPFGMRLVSGFAGAGTCLLVWGLGRRMFGPQVGRLAALVLATAPIMLIESKLATTDATLALWFVGGQFCLWELNQRPSRRVAAVFWLLLALGILTKGPVPAALLAAAGLVSWWWGGPTACWKRLEWRRGLMLLAVVTLPWFVAIGIVSRGDFYRVAVGFHIIQRVTSGIEEHGGLSRLLRGPVAVDVLSLVGALARGALRRLVAAAERPGVRLSARLDRRPARLPRAGPDQADPLLSPRLSGLRTSGGLAGREPDPRGSGAAGAGRWAGWGSACSTASGSAAVVALAAAACVVQAPVRWPCLLLAVVLAAGTLSAVLRLYRGATDRGVAWLIATWAMIGSLDRHLAAPRARALPHGPARRRAAGDPIRPAQARAGAADVPGTKHHLRIRPPGPHNQGLGRPVRAAPAAWRGDCSPDAARAQGVLPSGPGCTSSPARR